MVNECVLVGEGTLAIRGGEILINAGFTVCAYVSPDRSLKRSAVAAGVPHFTSDAELESFLRPRPTPYLFSLNNPIVLRPATLACITTVAINIHDSLLPAYAGLNATSWALMDGQQTHGVTAHEIVPKIDAGLIYGQRVVPVSAGDTAYSLNAACFDASENLFESLIDAIKQDRLSPHAMPDTGRSYFGKNARPENGGFLDFKRPAVELDRMVRALDFGNVPNPLCSAKVIWNDQVFIASGSSIDSPRKDELDTPTGTVGRTPHTLRIRCGTDILVIRELHELWGTPVEFSELDVACVLDSEPRKTWTDLDPSFPSAESRAKLRLGLRKLKFPITHVASEAPSIEKISIADAAKAVCSSDCPDELWITGVAVMAMYLWRLEPGRTFGYASKLSREQLGTDDPFLRNQRLVRIPNTSGRSFGKWRDRLQRELQHAATPIPRDLLYRGTGQARQLTAASLMVCDGVDTEDFEGGDTQFSLDGDLILRSARFSAHQLARVAAHLRELARSISATPEADIRQHSLSQLAGGDAMKGLPLLARPPMRLDFSSSPADAPALRSGQRELTYGELERHSHNAAAGLRALGIGPGQRVGLRLSCPVDSVIGIYAVLRAGAAYVPMDPELPESRLRVIADDSSLALLLQDTANEDQEDQEDQENRENQGPTTRSLTALMRDGAATNGLLDESAQVIRGDDEAYIIFTSGTTGRPKGIRILRSNLEAQLSARFQAFGDPAPIRFLCLHSMAFDSSVAGLFWTGASGGELCVTTKDERRDPKTILKMVRTWGATHLDIPPSLYLELLQEPTISEAFQTLRVVIVGGEECLPELARQHAAQLPQAQLYNEYGPTEATVFCTLYAVPTQNIPEPVPIGRPIPGVELLFLDRFGTPLPAELPGELCVSGPTVSPGYIGRPKLTSARFFTAENGKRVYRTGDRAYLDDHDQVRFVGRLDNQVQVNGHRVELAEIEAVMLTLPNVQEAAVAARKSGGQTRLFGYYVGPNVDVSELRRELSLKLPSYMVPSAFAAMASIPLDAAGKIARVELPKIVPSDPRYVSPTTDLEQEIAQIFGNVLTVRAGLEGNFFELGGSSLEALRVVRALREKGHSLNVATLYHHPTVRKLAATILDVNATRWSALVPIQPEGGQPPLFAIHILGRANEYYMPLSKRLGEDYPIYGLTAQVKLDEAEAQPVGVEELASIYIEEMKRKQPHGPYHLAAVSIAGSIAYEMAQRLTAGGDTVALLLFFDTKGPVPPMNTLMGRGSHHATLLRERGLSYVRERVEERFEEGRARWLGRFAKFLQHRRLPVPNALRLYRVMDDNMTASVAYTPAPYQGQITVFRATKRVFYPQAYVDEGFGWGEVALGGVNVIDIEGEHTGMLTEPAVTALASQLRVILGDLDTATSKTKSPPRPRTNL